MARIPEADRRLLLARQLVALLLLVAIALVLSPRRARVVALLALALLLLERRLEFENLYPAVPAEAFYPRLALLEKIPRGMPERVVGLGMTFVPNVAALYEVEDARGYEAMHLASFVETFPLWCTPQGIWFNRVDDPTKPFLSFLNVRYVIAPANYSPPSGWPVLYRGPEGLLLENPKALPRVFVPRHIYRESDERKQRERLLSIRDFGTEGVVGGTPGETENGVASVAITSYGAQRMEMEIKARSRALVATSMTGWPGWRLEIDERPAPLLSYNRAFLAFEVAPGRHVAVLRYWPHSFTLGLWISGISLIVVFWLFGRYAWIRRALGLARTRERINWRRPSARRSETA